MKHASWVGRAALPLCVAMAAVIACLAERASVQGGLLTGEPCAPPCWQGLTPGVSTEQELQALLDSSDQVDPGSLRRESGGCGQLTYWKNRRPYAGLLTPSSWTSNYACTSHKMLKVVMEYLTYEVELEQLIDSYGPPDAFSAQPAGIPERPYVEVNLYYPSRGLMCQLELADQEEPLQPEARIVRAWYFAPTSLESLASPGSGVPFPPAEYVADVLQEWQGYGPLELK